MEKVLLILESDITAALLQNALTDYEVHTCRADEAAATLPRLQPDALILDLFLSGTDGLTLLENCSGHLPPVVLAISPLVTDYVQQKAARLGVGFVIPKTATIDYIVTRLSDMLLMQKFPELPAGVDIVDSLLDKFRLHAKPRVIAALHAGILMAVRDPDCLLTKEIYPELRSTYGCTEGAVDQAIRRALRKAWELREQNPEVWDTFFPGYTECPSNGDFISTLARYLRRNYPSRFRTQT